MAWPFTNMKLFANINSNEGKSVKIGSNELITALLFLGNANIGLLAVNFHNNELVYNRREGNNFVPVFRIELTKGTFTNCTARA